jgi:hypothetical protein
MKELYIKILHAFLPMKELYNNMLVLILQIKLSSVQLARKYMKRVASELDELSGPEKEPAREFLILQGVRFAFRVHQVHNLGHFLKYVDRS